MFLSNSVVVSGADQHPRAQVNDPTLAIHLEGGIAGSGSIIAASGADPAWFRSLATAALDVAAAIEARP